MPRSYAGKYTPAYDIMLSIAERSGIEVKSASDILIRGVNQNRVMMRGRVIDFTARREDILHGRTFKGGSDSFIARDFFRSGLHVIPAYFAENGFTYRAALCDEASNIYLGSVGGTGITQVIASASLRNYDQDKLLREVFNKLPATVLPGVQRSDEIWGKVILWLLDLQDRNALTQMRTTQALVKSVTDAHSDINPSTISHVLAYVVANLNRQRGTGR